MIQIILEGITVYQVTKLNYREKEQFLTWWRSPENVWSRNAKLVIDNNTYNR